MKERRLVPALTRFWAKVDKRGPDECWPWLGSVSNQGYGRFHYESRNRRSHRVAYELLVGPIPDGLTIDHLCCNRSCQNPAHMEPVTQRENNLRGESLTAKNSRKTHCPQGHPYDDENLYVHPSGARQCRACSRIKARLRAGQAKVESA